MEIVNNHYLNRCHPETCSCRDWALVDEKGKVIARDDDKEYLEYLMKKKMELAK